MIEKWHEFEIAPYRNNDFEPIAVLFRDVYVKTYPHFDSRFFELKRFRTILREDSSLENLRACNAPESLYIFLLLSCINSDFNLTSKSSALPHSKNSAAFPSTSFMAGASELNTGQPAAIASKGG